ncbi:MAG TPA: LuxR C-terminal-related transcriptional regulator [Solirubrobacteraceae bacterium]|jgi:DNA-binding CsgD family transcriptional regulator|nr:LuxR C-terminal-related transcriptional regulator [Solirubrobacteraceae bacterium]
MSDRRDSSRHAGKTGEAATEAPGTRGDEERGLELLLGVSSCLRSWASFKPGTERLLGEIADRLGQAAGALWLPDGDALVARAVWSSGSVDHSALEEFLRSLRLLPGEGPAGHAWIHAQPVSANPVVSGRTHSMGGLRGTLGLPALARGEVMCVIELYSTSAPQFSDRLMHVLGTVAHELGAFFARRRGELDLSPLTAREVEVLTLASIGLPVGGIGERLTISRGTVKSHLEHIYAKLGVVNRTAAVAQALRSGLIE